MISGEIVAWTLRLRYRLGVSEISGGIGGSTCSLKGWYQSASYTRYTKYPISQLSRC